MIYQKVASRSANVNLPSFFVFLVLGAEFFFGRVACADNVSILNVESSCIDQICTFNVTLEHDDAGWEHYADFWQIVSADGIELGKRVLLHPHVNEQPFTRSLSGVNIPKDIKTVWVEAHDSVHGKSPHIYKVEF